jgi:hypothetical protein
MSLAYTELYTYLAGVFFKFCNKEVRDDATIGTLGLIETTYQSVKVLGDCFIHVQKLGLRA